MGYGKQIAMYISEKNEARWEKISHLWQYEKDKTEAILTALEMYFAKKNENIFEK